MHWLRSRSAAGLLSVGDVDKAGADPRDLFGLNARHGWHPTGRASVVFTDLRSRDSQGVLLFTGQIERVALGCGRLFVLGAHAFAPQLGCACRLTGSAIVRRRVTRDRLQASRKS